jgi:hypothetical protein
LDQLENWPKLLVNFKSSPSHDSRTTPAVQSHSPPANIRHMKLLSQLVDRKSDATIFINIQLAAMRLHQILAKRTDVSFSSVDELLNLVTPQEDPLIML